MWYKISAIPRAFIVLLFAAMILVGACRKVDADNQNKGKMEQVKKSILAGAWYPGNAAELAGQLQVFLENAKKPKINGQIFAIIAPHAGYAYSGYTAAHSYKQITGLDFNTVIIISPAHQEYVSGASIYPGAGFETPLGVAKINKELAKKIVAASDHIEFSMNGHQKEHSVEIQVPFVQTVLPGAQIVPIVLGARNWPVCRDIGEAIARAIGDAKVLLVASTDLYHGYDYAACNEIDAKTRQAIQNFNPEKFCQGLNNETFQACGGGPVVVVQIAAKRLGANRCEIIFHTNSADATGQKAANYVVGYTAAVIYKEATGMTEQKVGVELGLNDEDKQTLLNIAYETIEQVVNGQRPNKYNIESNILKEKRGAFVTIKKGDDLRGCIGYIYAYKPLYETIIDMAEAAALRDPRFPPVTPDELKTLNVEISVLTPIQEITDVNDIKIGTHGLIIEKQGRSGLLLPQVATDYNWDRETFLSHTCQKAGLPANAWKQPGTKIKIFSAQVFGESSKKL